MTDSEGPQVRVELVELDAAGHRQISPRRKVTALLKERREDIHAAIAETITLMQAVEDCNAGDGTWRVKSLEATFGITLTTEAGVLISKLSAEASFGVTIRLERPA